MTKQRVLTLVIFITVAILWIFGGYLNPIISQSLGLPKPIGSFDSMVALSAAIVICVTGIASLETSTRKYRMGCAVPLRWRFNLKLGIDSVCASKIMADGIVFIIEVATTM